MATLTAVTGNWTTSSAAANTAFGGLLLTTAADEIIVPTGVTVTVPTGVSPLCRSLTVQSGGAFIWSGTAGVTIGDATAGTLGVALSISSGSTITAPVNGGTIDFVSSSATQQTLATGGKTVLQFRLNNTGSWKMLDAWTANGNQTQMIWRNFGAFDTGGFNISAGTVSFGSVAQSVAGTLTLGASVFTLNFPFGGSGIDCTPSVGAGFTITANTAVFNITSIGSSNTTANMNGASLVMSGVGSAIVLGGTWKDVTRTGTAVKTDLLTLNANITCTGSFIVNSNSLVNRVLVTSNTLGTARTITAATFTATNTPLFRDITGAGAATWTAAASGASEIGDCHGNSGITFTTTKSRYGVVAGNESSTATWSTTSGGSGGASVPLPQDTIVLDGSSAAGTYTMDMGFVCKDLTCTGFTRTLSMSAGWSIFGSLTLGSGMTVTFGTGTFSGRGSSTITTAGKSINANMTFAPPGGTYAFSDAYSSTGSITHTWGTINTGGFSVTITNYDGSATNTKALTLGASNVSLTSTSGTPWNIASSGLTASLASSTITISTTSASTRTFASAGLTYGTIDYTVAGSTGQLTVTGSLTFAGFRFSDVTNARIVAFTSSTTVTLTSATGWVVNGTSGKLMSVIAVTSGTFFTLTCTSGTVSSDYLSVKDSHAGGGATFYAGANSTNVSGNTGWLFTAPPSLATGNFFLLF